MPHRILMFLGMLSTVDWKALTVFVGAAVAIPSNGMPIWVEVLVRILTPIVGGILWVYLKPKVIKWKNRKKMKKAFYMWLEWILEDKPLKFWKVVVSLFGASILILIMVKLINWIF